MKSTPPTSPLHRITTNTTNSVWDRDQRGAYLIDRDPIYFAPVLNFLRHGHLLLNRDVSEEGVLIEAEYFGLPDLVSLVRQRMNEHKAKLPSYHHQADHLNLNEFESLPLLINQQSNCLANFINNILKQKDNDLSLTIN